MMNADWLDGPVVWATVECAVAYLQQLCEPDSVNILQQHKPGLCSLWLVMPARAPVQSSGRLYEVL